MLKYQLICENDDEFEGWFSSSSAFSDQQEKGLISCPICGSGSVRRALMAPNLNSPKTRKNQPHMPADAIASQTQLPEINATDLPSGQSAGQSANKASSDPLASLDAKDKAAMVGAAMTVLRDMHKKVKADFTNVGDKFADEARKIHYGEAEKKPIYGTTTPEEREELSEEGVTFFELPDLPQDH